MELRTRKTWSPAMMNRVGNDLFDQVGVGSEGVHLRLFLTTGVSESNMVFLIIWIVFSEITPQ